MGIAPHIEVEKDMKEEAGSRKDEASRMQEAHHKEDQRTIGEDKEHCH